MRIATVSVHGAERVAVVRDDRAVLLAPRLTALDLLRADPGDRDDLVARHGDSEVALAELALRSPVRPGALRDFVSFERHVQGMRPARGTCRRRSRGTSTPR